MSYTPPIEKEVVRHYENRFLVYAALSLLFLGGLTSSFYLPRLNAFWKDNIIWATGSVLVFLSAIQMKYFNIKKNASPDNRRFKAVDFRRWVHFIESVFNHMWVIGFVLIAISRWIKL